MPQTVPQPAMGMEVAACTAEAKPPSHTAAQSNESLRAHAGFPPWRTLMSSNHWKTAQPRLAAPKAVAIL